VLQAFGLLISLENIAALSLIKAYFLFSLVLFLFSFLAKKKKEMNISNDFRYAETTSG